MDNRNIIKNTVLKKTAQYGLGNYALETQPGQNGEYILKTEYGVIKRGDGHTIYVITLTYEERMERCIVGAGLSFYDSHKTGIWEQEETFGNPPALRYREIHQRRNIGDTAWVMVKQTQQEGEKLSDMHWIEEKWWNRDLGTTFQDIWNNAVINAPTNERNQEILKIAKAQTIYQNFTQKEAERSR